MQDEDNFDEIFALLETEISSSLERSLKSAGFSWFLGLRRKILEEVLNENVEVFEVKK